MLRPAPRLVHGALALALAVSWTALAPAFADTKPKDLPARYRQWLEDVDFLISGEERKAFLKLDEDYQRDGFIRRFWEARDPDPASQGNQYRDLYFERLEEARRRYRFRTDERVRIYALNGDPHEIQEIGPGECKGVTEPIQIWKYAYTPRIGRSILVIFYQRGGAGPFRIWRAGEGHGVLVPIIEEDLPLQVQRAAFRENVLRFCGEIDFDVLQLLADFDQAEREGPAGPQAAMNAQPARDPEWLLTFQGMGTELDDDATNLEATLSFEFPGMKQSRVIVRALLEVPVDAPVAVDLGGQLTYNLDLFGEILRDGELFESFRYSFTIPDRGVASLPLTFERHLRPGSYDLQLKLEDANGRAAFRAERPLVVPALEIDTDYEDSRSTPTADRPGESGLDLRAEDTELHSGNVRFTASVTGDAIRKVLFLLEDKPLATKTRPPYSVELNLGSVPRTRSIRAIGLDAGGNEIATDEILLNAGHHSFVAHLVEPRHGQVYSGEVRALVEVQVPSGALVERVELFLNEAPVATIFQPPYTARIPVDSAALAYLRAVAHLADGSTTEDAVLFNAPGFVDAVEVRMIELYATVLDRDGRPVYPLERDQFTVSEDGRVQEILRFETQDNLPIHAVLLLDSSASMADLLETVRSAAMEFLESIVGPRDRAAVITFSERPRLAAPFTNEIADLANALGGLHAEQSTALYDSLRFALYYFQGIKGQKALLVLSDGADRRSQVTWDEVLEYAQSAGVTIFTIGLPKVRGREFGRLERLAAETGGRAFRIASIDELGAVYDTIQRELRARYLLVYQSPGDGSSEFRSVDVRVARPGLEVRTLKGYVP